MIVEHFLCLTTLIEVLHHILELSPNERAREGGRECENSKQEEAAAMWDRGGRRRRKEKSGAERRGGGDARRGEARRGDTPAQCVHGIVFVALELYDFLKQSHAAVKLASGENAPFSPGGDCMVTGHVLCSCEPQLGAFSSFASKATNQSEQSWGSGLVDSAKEAPAGGAAHYSVHCVSR